MRVRSCRNSAAAARELERAEDARAVSERGRNDVVGQVAVELRCTDVAGKQTAYLLPRERQKPRLLHNNAPETDSLR